MKKLIFFSFLFVLTSGLSAQKEYKLTKSAIKMTGTSTLHDWSADVTKVTGNGQLTFNNNTLTGIKSLTIAMVASSIKSEKGSTMDNNMQKALKAKSYPNITYSLAKVNSISQKAGIYTLETEGKLTIAGTTNTIALSVTGKVAGNEVNFKGSKKLKMSDYKVEAPVLFLGTLKTDDNVTISFDATFQGGGAAKK